MRMRRKRKPKRRGYVRPSRAQPKTGWSLRQLANLSGVTARTIRLYMQRDVLPRPPFLGSATRYQRRQLLCLLAIRRLLVSEKLTLASIRTRLQALSAPELETFATERVPPGPIADALGIKPAAAMSGAGPAGAPYAARGETPSPQGARWVRTELALGLELHVREDASSRVLALAHRLRELCASDVADAHAR